VSGKIHEHKRNGVQIEYWESTYQQAARILIGQIGFHKEASKTRARPLPQISTLATRGCSALTPIAFLLGFAKVAGITDSCEHSEKC